jgi:hypothetical protein
VNFADNAQLVGERFVGRRCVEISSGYFSRKTHRSVCGRCQMIGPSYNDRRLSLCGNRCRRHGCLLNLSRLRRIQTRHSLPAQRHLPLSSVHLAGWRLTRPSSCPHQVVAAIGGAVQAGSSMLLLQLVKQFSDLGVSAFNGLDFALQSFGCVPRPRLSPALPGFISATRPCCLAAAGDRPEAGAVMRN